MLTIRRKLRRCVCLWACGFICECCLCRAVRRCVALRIVGSCSVCVCVCVDVLYHVMGWQAILHCTL